MTTVSTPRSVDAPMSGGAPPGKSWFGHPRGLSTLFFTEMWERFSYYGMRAILLLFMTAPVAAGGLGWDAAKAGPIYGLYTALVYLTALPGGWLADQFIGPRRAVLIGGTVIALGHVCLAMHGMSWFFLGLFFIVMGTGLLKPNISAMVGQLYSDADKRRDAGFSIFYMGINIGAGLSPVVIGFLAQHAWFKAWLLQRGLRPEDSWHWGFGAAAVGMTLGLIQYVLGGKHLGRAGIEVAGRAHPEEQRKATRTLRIAAIVTVALVAVLWAAQASGRIHITPELVTKVLGWLLIILPFAYFIPLLLQRGWTPVERRRIAAIPAFFLFASLFWSVFEQAGSTLTLFADRMTNNSVLGHAFPSSWWQSVNSAFLILLAPVFAYAWVKLGKREPSSPAKFAYGLFFAGFGFLIMVAASSLSGSEGRLVSPMWLLSVYFVHTVGELCLSPVGLSTMTKLAPARVAGQMLGVWFLASSVGNFIGGNVAGLFEKLPLPQLFGAVVGVTFFFTLVAIALAKPIRKLMGGVH